MLQFFRTVLAYMANAFVLIVLFPPFILLWLITLPFDKERIILHYFNCFYASSFIFLNPTWRFKLSGRENYRKGRTYLMVANHQSYADIVSVNQLYRNFKWVSKQEVYKYPIVGWVLFLTKYITLRRENRSSIAKMYKRCAEVLQKRISVVMFPEGTRSKDGSVQRFKTGAFKLALEQQVPILPIVLKGTYFAYPNNGYYFPKRANIQVKVLPEIPYEQYKSMPLTELTKMIENKIRTEFEQL